VPEQSQSGIGALRSGQHDLGVTHYEIHVGIPNRPGVVVELPSPPRAQDGEVLDLTLEDGRVLQIQVRGVSPYCRVLGERPPHERRIRPSEEAPSVTHQPSAASDQGRRRSDSRGPIVIIHPCQRCMANEVLVTHRGVMLTTLLCTACGHGWGESPAAVAAATRVDRRAVARPDSADRRSDDRLVAPTCTYCSTDAHVRSMRRTPQEVYFVCSECEAMWALPRPTGGSGQRSPVLG
jgi:hypothetical protein